MAIKINKKGSSKEEAPATLAYLNDENRTAVEALPAEVKAKFEAVTELTPELIEEVSQEISEELMEALIGQLEDSLKEQTPAEVTPVPAKIATAQAPVADGDAADRKARRDALKAQIAANTTGATVVQQKVTESPLPQEAKDAAPTAMPGLDVWNSLFPIGMAVTVINRGNGKFELHVGDVKVKAEPAAAKEVAAKAKKVSAKTVSNNPAFHTPEYKEWLETMKTKYPDLESRKALAASLGLNAGDDWSDTTKDGKAMPPAIENMYVLDAIRNKQGIEIYIEGARTKEDRKAIASGEKPWPAEALAAQQ